MTAACRCASLPDLSTAPARRRPQDFRCLAMVPWCNLF
jgi:hypothetical protein